MKAEFKVKLEKKWLSKIAEFVEKTAQHMGCNNREIIEDLKLAVDEASSNIMTHGKAHHRKDYFIIRVLKKGQEFTIEIVDYGKPYAFEELSEPTDHLPWEERLQRGFGLKLLRKITENAEYETYADRNVLRFYKHF